MSNLIRSLCCRTSEQEQRENRRAMARAARASRSMPQADPIRSLDLRPHYPPGILPVWVTNMPLRGFR